MNKKNNYEMLLCYRENIAKIESLQAELSFWEDRLCFFKTISAHKKCEDIVKIIDSIIDELKNLIGSCIDSRDYCLKIISSLDDSVQREILTMRYINGLGFEEISKKVNYCRRHAQRIHNKAIENILA